MMRQAEAEQLRQERETFDFNKRQAKAWSRVRLSMAWSALVVYVSVALLCIVIILCPQPFPSYICQWAPGVLIADVLSFAYTVMNWVFTTSQGQRLSPVTHAAVPPAQPAPPTVS